MQHNERKSPMVDLADLIVAAARAIVAAADAPAQKPAPLAVAPAPAPAEVKPVAAKKPKPAPAPVATAAAVAPVAPTAAPTPVANGTVTEETVRDALREVGKKVSREAAVNLLDDEGDGATNVAALKPELYATVLAACKTALIVGNTPAAAAKVADDFSDDEI